MKDLSIQCGITVRMKPTNHEKKEKKSCHVLGPYFFALIYCCSVALQSFSFIFKYFYQSSLADTEDSRSPPELQNKDEDKEIDDKNLKPSLSKKSRIIALFSFHLHLLESLMLFFNVVGPKILNFLHERGAKKLIRYVKEKQCYDVLFKRSNTMSVHFLQFYFVFAIFLISVMISRVQHSIVYFYRLFVCSMSVTVSLAIIFTCYNVLMFYFL